MPGGVRLPSGPDGGCQAGGRFSGDNGSPWSGISRQRIPLEWDIPTTDPLGVGSPSRPRIPLEAARAAIDPLGVGSQPWAACIYLEWDPLVARSPPTWLGFGIRADPCQRGSGSDEEGGHGVRTTICVSWSVVISIANFFATRLPVGPVCVTPK